MVDEIEQEFLDSNRYGTEQVRDRIIDELEEKIEELVKKVLSGYYDSFRFMRRQSKMIVSLKEFLEKELNQEK